MWNTPRTLWEDQEKFSEMNLQLSKLRQLHQVMNQTVSKSCQIKFLSQQTIDFVFIRTEVTKVVNNGLQLFRVQMCFVSPVYILITFLTRPKRWSVI